MNKNEEKELVFKGNFICDNPKTYLKRISKYPSTGSDNLIEHILEILNPVAHSSR